MEAKAALTFFLQMALVQLALAQCVPVALRPEAYAPIEYGAPGPFVGALAMAVPWLPAPSFAVAADELLVAGTVAVSGSLPFAGTVALEGAVPAQGRGEVAFCAGGEGGARAC